jgi:hypothetical protein
VTSLKMMSQCRCRILMVMKQLDEFGEELNSQNQSSVVLIHDSCDIRTDQSFDSSLPSARIDRSKLTHLSADQQQELLQLIDEFRECFDELQAFVPMLNTVSPLMLILNRGDYGSIVFPRFLNRKNNARIEELLKNGFIRPSNSPMASPIVAVLTGPSGKGGVRIAIYYRLLISIHKVMLLLHRICWIRSKRWGQLVISLYGMLGSDIGNWA